MVFLNYNVPNIQQAISYNAVIDLYFFDEAPFVFLFDRGPEQSKIPYIQFFSEFNYHVSHSKPTFTFCLALLRAISLFLREPGSSVEARHSHRPVQDICSCILREDCEALHSLYPRCSG